MDDIFTIVRDAERDYIAGNTTLSKHVVFSLQDNVDKEDAYVNSKHTTGDTDGQGREKPFFNIVNAAVSIWYRATDIDRANIRIKATKSSDHILALIANIHLQEWMKKSGYGMFLNKWGHALARSGSSICEFVEKDGELIASVLPWNKTIVDSVDITNAPIIKKLYLTPAQIRKNKAYNKDIVKGLLEALSTRKTLGGDTKDNKSDFIEVYEVHGELPLSFLTDKEDDEDTYVQQMHVVSYLTKTDGKGGYDDFCLLKGKEKNPHILTHLIETEGRTKSIGAVEHLFEAQWMVNHNEKAIKDQLDLASKLFFQTSDEEFMGKNAMDIENGSFFLTKVNQGITQVNNGSHDISSLQNSKNDWRGMGQEVTGTPDAIRGNTMPSGTAARQVEALIQQSSSLFEIMTENKGLYIEMMMRLYVIPFLKKKMDSAEEIAATLSDAGIKQIDAMYLPNEAIRRHNAKNDEAVLNGEIPSPYMKDIAEQEVRDELSPLGNQRFFKPSDISDKTWKELFKNFEWECEVEVTGEDHDKQATLTTLTTLLKTIITPEGINEERAKFLYNKILEETGVVSPSELSSIPQNPPPQPTAPVAP